MVELPSYIGGLIAIHNAGAEFVGVRQDSEGINTDDLRQKIDEARESGRRVKLIYTIPNFQNPSGVTLSAARRNQLIEVAEEYDLLIVEDDPYGELYFDSALERPSPLVSLCPHRVIYLSSFSKVLAPGLRTAWAFAPDEIAAKMELAKEGADLSSSILDQAIVAEASRSGLIERRLPDIRKFYGDRCRAMLDTLSQHAPAKAKWTEPTGGFFILMEVDSQIDATEMLLEAIECGVAYVPGQPFFVDSSGSNTLRLAYSKESTERIIQGIEILCRLLKQKAGINE
jgi:2-aminoadipate transaminase